MNVIYNGGSKELFIPYGKKIGINCNLGTVIVYYSTSPSTPLIFYEHTRVTRSTTILGPFTKDEYIKLEALDANVEYDIAINPYVVSITDLNWKQSARAATTVAGTLETSFTNGQTIDGVTLATGDRIVIKNQVSASENGIYQVKASGAPIRTDDANTSSELVAATISIREGSVNADRDLFCTNNSPIDIGTTSIIFVDKASTTNHNLLSGLQGGTSNEYYHLNSSQHSDVSTIVSAGHAVGMDQGVSTTNSPGFVGTTLSSLNVNELVATDGTKGLQSLGVSTYPSLTETSYVKGVTSSIQTQLDGKQATLTNGVDALTSDEVDQLSNINTTTVSTTQWGYLGAMNQGVATSSHPQFADITATSSITAGSIIRGSGGSLVNCAIQPGADSDTGINRSAANTMQFVAGAVSTLQTTSTLLTANVNLNLNAKVLQVSGTQVVSTRATGWGAPTGTATRTAFDTSSVTLSELAERTKALIDDLTTHGLIGS